MKKYSFVDSKPTRTLQRRIFGITLSQSKLNLLRKKKQHNDIDDNDADSECYPVLDSIDENGHDDGGSETDEKKLLVGMVKASER